MLKILRILPVVLLLLPVFSSAAAEEQKFSEIKQMAEQGNRLAQAKLGSIYYLGGGYQLLPNARYKTKARFRQIRHLLEGVQQDDRLAAEWMLKAAKQGLVEAEIFMAALYDSGAGVSQSTSEADKWYRKAADQGNGTAKAILGGYKATRLKASKQIPLEYALEILTK